MRSLGVFCQYPCLSDDTGFLMDCAERLKEGLDLKEQLSVRTQAGWAAGNLTDSFNSDESRVEVLPFLFPSLVACATLAMKDNEKVSVKNSVSPEDLYYVNVHVELYEIMETEFYVFCGDL